MSIPCRERFDEWDPARVAFFVDFDDTLIEPQPDPVNFVLPVALRALATRLARQENLRFVIATGRSIAQIDAFFAPHRFPVIGCHGAEIRMTGSEPVQPLSRQFPDALHSVIGTLADDRGWLLEKKAFGISVHCLASGQDAGEASRAIERRLARFRRDWCVCLAGRCVDVRSSDASKGSAIQLFQRRPHYAGRRTVYIGDDAASDPSLAFLTTSGGALVEVGRPEAAARGQGFASPAQVRLFLKKLIRGKLR